MLGSQTRTLGESDGGEGQSASTVQPLAQKRRPSPKAMHTAKGPHSEGIADAALVHTLYAATVGHRTPPTTAHEVADAE